MSIFAYDPNAAKTWANSIVKYLNGDADSIYSNSKKFTDQIEKLVQPNVWTGAAAAKNYQNFLDTHKALVNFSNKFGEAFEQSMNAINKSVSDLEVANLGADTNVSTTFGTLTFAELSALSEENIKKDVVRYDYATIIGIGTSLSTILQSLETVYKNLDTKINELNNGTSIWDGDAAESARQTLSSTLKTNMDKVIENLNICIKNISTAAEAAQMADIGK